MPVDYTEKRNFFRMNMECNAEYTVDDSGSQKTGKVKNLSGDGMSIIIDQPIELGAELRVSIQPANTVTPPLNIVMEVLRCEAKESNCYLLAGNITQQ